MKVKVATASDLLTLFDLAHDLGHDVDWVAADSDGATGYQVFIREASGVTHQFFIGLETSATSEAFFNLLRQYSTEKDAKGN